MYPPRPPSPFEAARNTKSCFICFEETSLAEGQFLECFHFYCLGCIKAWCIEELKERRRGSCPECRWPINPELHNVGVPSVSRRRVSIDSLGIPFPPFGPLNRPLDPPHLSQHPPLDLTPPVLQPVPDLRAPLLRAPPAPPAPAIPVFQRLRQDLNQNRGSYILGAGLGCLATGVSFMVAGPVMCATLPATMPCGALGVRALKTCVNGCCGGE